MRRRLFGAVLRRAERNGAAHLVRRGDDLLPRRAVVGCGVETGGHHRHGAHRLRAGRRHTCRPRFLAQGLRHLRHLFFRVTR